MPATSPPVTSSLSSQIPLLAAPGALERDLARFQAFRRPTAVLPGTPSTVASRGAVPAYANEFWTSRQRAGNSLHEISYRACFKPEVPGFFLDRLSRPGDIVYDPFMGRGTTLIEAALRGRVPAGCDINPLGAVLVGPRLHPPTFEEVRARLERIPMEWDGELRDDLLAFYHSDTLREILALRHYLLGRQRRGTLDAVDQWIRMVAVNRLTGHSPGFFSVYTLPPNQAVSVRSQERINKLRGQTPPYREIRPRILRKTRALLRDLDAPTRATLEKMSGGARLWTQDAAHTPEIPSSSVSLVVTSPPFLDVVNYAQDNWLRLWFCGIDPASIPLTMTPDLDSWMQKMTDTFSELRRVLRPGGHIAFEVGEIRGGALPLEEAVVASAERASLRPRLVMINRQQFTKTAQVWGVDNGRKGTNTNRIVVIRKDTGERP